MTSQALSGTRVLDLSHHIAGPVATRLLAAYGADVVKVEPPWGDATRRWGPFPDGEQHPEKSGYFLALNTGKRGLALDLTTTAARETVLALAGRADLIVESFRPGVLDSLGLSWDLIRRVNARLVLVSISNFGQDGPYAQHHASPLTAFAMSGQMWLTGEPGGGAPRKNHGHQAAYQAGYNAFAAALAVLFGARRSGIGDRVDISIQEVQAATLEMYGPNAYNHDRDTYRLGNVVRATWGIYPCADGYIGIHALPRNVGPLFRAIGEPEMAETYAGDQAALLRDNDAIEAMLYAWCAERARKEIFEIALRERAPFAYVTSVGELLDWPGLVEKGFWNVVDHPVAGPFKYAGPPFRMSASPYLLRRAPLLGEHTEEVLRDWLG